MTSRCSGTSFNFSTHTSIRRLFRATEQFGSFGSQRTAAQSVRPKNRLRDLPCCTRIQSKNRSRDAYHLHRVNSEAPACTLNCRRFHLNHLTEQQEPP